jgi:hypothetical protein
MIRKKELLMLKHHGMSERKSMKWSLVDRLPLSNPDLVINS